MVHLIIHLQSLHVSTRYVVRTYLVAKEIINMEKMISQKPSIVILPLNLAGHPKHCIRAIIYK